MNNIAKMMQPLQEKHADPYARCLLNIVRNNYGVEISTGDIIPLVEEVEAETGVRIDFKHAVYYYTTERGWEQKRKLKNTYILSVPRPTAAIEIDSPFADLGDVVDTDDLPF